MFSSLFIIVLLFFGCAFLDYKNYYLENSLQSIEENYGSDQKEGFLINFLNKKDENGNPIWMIVVGVLFFFFLIFKIFFID